MSDKEKPAPRGNAESRAITNVGEKQNKAFESDWEGDFGVAFLARRYHLAAPLARAVAALAGLRRAFG